VWHGLAIAAVMPKMIVVRGAKLAGYAGQDNGQVICAQVGLVPIGTIHAQQEVFPSQCAQVGPLPHES
jgi:hypothetical protein